MSIHIVVFQSDGVHNSHQKTLKVKRKVGRKLNYKNEASNVDKEVQTGRFYFFKFIWISQ